MWPNPETADLVTFTEEILNGKLQFLCSGNKEKWIFNSGYHGNNALYFEHLDTQKEYFTMLDIILIYLNQISVEKIQKSFKRLERN